MGFQALTQALFFGILPLYQAQFFPATSSSFPSSFSSTSSSFPSTSSSFPSTSSSFPSTSFTNNFFTPSFAASPLPVQLAFPSGFTSQTLFLPARPAPKLSKKDNAGAYTPPSVKIPVDPTASASLTNLLTNSNDKVVDGKGAKAIKALYDQNSFRSFNMEMTAANKNLMNADPTSELAVHCRVTTDYNTPQAKTWSDFGVGCGYKGSVGSLRVCLDENGKDNHICRKLSYRVDARVFDTKNTSSPLIDGMESLFFGGMPVDLSMVSERTAYSLMGSLGMVASLSTHAKLFLNGKYLGLFSFVQGVDEQFTKMHFPNDDRKGKGALYKELWLNPIHMKDSKEALKGGSKQDDAFMQQVMSAIESTPLTGDAPQQFFDKYFDAQSFIDMTAFNTAIGSTDDWRQRHNFYLYVRQQKKDKKLVFIPWDYDRLYDSGSDTRGIMKGNPWWDIKTTATPMACNALIISTQEQAQLIGGSPLKVAWNKDILDQFPVDMNIPVTCDKITQLMAQALGPKVRQRTREIASAISITRVRSLWQTWSAQIKTALENDPAGPTYSVMLQNQALLEAHLTKSLAHAVSEANQGDISFGSVSSPASTFSSSTFSSSTVPKAAPSFSSSSFSSSFSPPSFSTGSFSTPSTSPFSSTPSFSTGSFSSSPFSTSTFSTPSSSFASFPASAPSTSWG